MSIVIFIFSVLIVWIPATPMIMMYWAFGVAGITHSTGMKKDNLDIIIIGVILVFFTYFAIPFGLYKLIL